MTFYATYPVEGGSGGTVPTYATLSLFPSAVGAGNGALAIALDTDILYISNGTIWEVLADPAISPFAITQLHGDGAATGPGNVALTLSTVNSNVGTFGTASSVGTFTANAKGLVTAASNTSIQIAESQVTNLVSDLAGKVPTTRTISTTAPLTGGGDLSVDRTIAIPAATGSVNGYLTSTDWTTFNSKQNALTIGDLTDVGTDGITVTGGTGAVIGSGTSLSQHVADASHNGYLSQTDWSTFNSKQSATLTNTHILVGNGSNVATDVPMSGDATIANTGALTLKNTGTAGTYVKVTTDAQGRVTSGSASPQAIADGGTGQATANAALNALLPTQTSNSGKVLTTNGTDSSWIASGAIAATTGSDATTTLTIADANTQIVTPSIVSRVYKLPTTSVLQGAIYHFINNAAVSSTNATIQVQASDGSIVRTVYPQTQGSVVALQATPTASTHWMGLEPIVSNWISDTGFTINSFGTPTNVEIYSRRNGDTFEVHGRFVGGTVAGAIASFTLSTTYANLAIDYAKIGTTTNGAKVGMYTTVPAAGGTIYPNVNNLPGDLFVDGSDTTHIYMASSEGTTNYNKDNANGIINNSKGLTFHYSIPIDIWGANRG